MRGSRLLLDPARDFIPDLLTLDITGLAQLGDACACELGGAHAKSRLAVACVDIDRLVSRDPHAEDSLFGQDNNAPGGAIVPD